MAERSSVSIISEGVWARFSEDQSWRAGASRMTVVWVVGAVYLFHFTPHARDRYPALITPFGRSPQEKNITKILHTCYKNVTGEREKC
jgi:hypothetical protein